MIYCIYILYVAHLMYLCVYNDVYHRYTILECLIPWIKIWYYMITVCIYIYICKNEKNPSQDTQEYSTSLTTKVSQWPLHFSYHLISHAHQPRTQQAHPAPVRVPCNRFAVANLSLSVHETGTLFIAKFKKNIKWSWIWHTPPRHLIRNSNEF